MRRLLTLVLFALLSVALVATPAMAKKKKKKGAEEAPPEPGAVFVGNFPCYRPPDFSKITSNGERKKLRQQGFEAVNKLVTGVAQDKSDAALEMFKIDNDEYAFFETAFLGRPQLLDYWLDENFAKCQAVGTGKMKEKAYFEYLSTVGRELESNECYKPLDYEWHDFLDIASDWQRRVHVCKGDKVLIETTGEENGQYTITDTGKMADNTFMTAAGDPNTPEAGAAGLVAEYPLGALLLRFEAEDDSYTKYYLIGASLRFTSPDHGTLSFAINDTTYFDNKFRDIKGAIDYLGVDIYPEEKPK